MPAKDMPAWIGQYEVIRHLGEGGMGVVYEAKDPFSKGSVALKVLPPGADKQSVGRFKIEAEAAGRLDHPAIVAIVGHGQTHDGKWFLAMEFVDGVSLDEHIGRNGPLAPRVVAKYVIQLCEALQFAHDQQILHRDLKPGNVMICRDGTLRLTDFGLAKLLEPGEDSLTRTGDILGTPSYMSPEQARGTREDMTVMTDVYGLGGTAYHMLTGRVPFDARSLGGVLRKIVSQPPRAPREIRPEIPEALEAIVLRCLAKEPAERYASMTELAQALQDFLDGRSGGGGGVGNTLILIALSSIALAVIGGVVAFLLTR